MGKPNIIALTCPQCGRVNDFELCEAVNPARNPEWKPRLLDGSVFRLTCGGCGSETEVGHQFLYRDTRLGFMLFLAEDREELEAVNASEAFRGMAAGDSAVTRLRGVLSPDDLREKVLIFDAGLDDRVVELLKPRLGAGRFLAREEGLLIFADAAGAAFPVATARYRELEESCRGRLPSEEYRYRVYDAGWAEAFSLS